MNKHSLLSWSRVAVLILAILTLSCNKTNKKAKSEDPQPVFSEELAEEISFVTSGDILIDDEIKIIFNNDVVEENEVGSSPKTTFRFNPDIKGRATWEQRDILTFYPDEPLPGRTSYEGKLKLKELSAYFEDKEVDELELRFNVPGRKILSLNGSIELKDRNDPKILIYEGSVQFSEKTSLEALQKAARVSGGKNIEISWSQIDDWNFQFTSSDIIRTDNNQTYIFKIDRDQLDLEFDMEKAFKVSPLKKMQVAEFRADEAGRKPRIRVSFSDELDMEQDIRGLISISPSLDFELKKLGKAVIIDGKFKFGETYKIEVQKGIRSRWGSATEDVKSKEITFDDIPPQLEFASDGIILPSSNNKKIQFYTTNLKRVHLQVKKVFPKQIDNFIRAEQLNSTKTRNRGFKSNYESNVGVIIKNQSLDLNAPENEWVLNEFDLTDLFEKYDDGLFLLRINFTPEDVAIPIEGDVLDYVVEKGQIYKPVFLSDLGITLKEADNQVYVFVTDLVSGKPKSSAEVRLLDYYGESVRSGRTNDKGLVTFSSNRYFSYVSAHDGKQTTALNRSEMEWSNSGFEIGGAREGRNSMKGFIYTERGVFRPGDSIHVGFIVRNNANTFPQDHPVNIQVRDPEYNMVFEQQLHKAKDGFYLFRFNTDEDAPTGTYSITINAGGSWFHDNLKIETVVAEQLEVKVKPGKKTYEWTDKRIEFDINSKYLFGAPASNLKAEAVIEVHPYLMTFPKYTEFMFTREDVIFKTLTQNVVKTELDAEGNLSTSWSLPQLGEVPSALNLKIIGKVLEKSGQPNEGWNMARLHIYPNYVGIKDPSGYGYYKIGSEVKFPVVLLDPTGNEVTGRQLQYRIYRNDKRWWYQYDSRSQYRLKYKEDSQTYLETEGTIDVTKGVNTINFTPSENGEYLIEVSDGGNGHTASMFFSAYRYGRASGGETNEGTLALKTDKEKYAPGEKAKIKLPNPKSGSVLVTLERGRQMVDWFWVNPENSKGDELIIEIPVDEDMLPNVYVSVSVIQPHEQTVNDRPIRMFGIIPLMVEDPDTKINYIISSDDNLVPNEDFTIKISTENRMKSQFTIAVVDEGLLSLTQFRTPQPWKEFYRKVALFLSTYDVFSHVISANKGDVFQTFSIGGADEMDYRESQLDPVDGKKRFEPVSFVKGPFFTDENGNASVDFHMPNYNGAVRVMVVGANKRSYGNAEKTIRVRSDIIMQPGIPRVLNPGDEFIIPVALFNMNPNVKQAQFIIETEGPLELISENNIAVDFSQESEADIQYRVRVKEEIGQAKIKITGRGGDVVVESETNIKVVPTATRLYDKSTHKVEKGRPLDVQVPMVGLEGTNYASMDVSVFPNMDFEHRLRWLIRYPYGCIEQTTSSVLPQLALKRVGYFDEDEVEEIDNNINSGIDRLQLFTISGGGFSYWPGNTGASEWGTIYATHFLTEARAQGYAVPDFLYNNAIEGLKRDARNHRGKLHSRIYRVFVLAMAGEQNMSEMNMLMENSLSEMSSTQKWMLATAYHLAGAEEVRNNILAEAGTTTTVYEPFSYNFGSKYRDDAIILYCATMMDRMEAAELLALSVAEKLSGKTYLSTQSTGFMLLGLAKYFEASGITAESGKVITGKITLADGSEIDFNRNNHFKTRIFNNFEKNVRFELLESSNVDQVYVTLSWNGVPMRDENAAVQNNLKLDVRWFSETGKEINPANLEQGTSIYGVFSVRNNSVVSEVSEVALVQILPSGWAVENTRLNNTVLPQWTRSWNTNKEEYFDIRDDRVMWFFDLKGAEQLDFIVKINCVNAGDFWLPSTLTEAMYNSDYRATTEGRKVHVEAFK